MDAQELLQYNNWVVVGDVLNPAKYAYRILHSLKNAEFNVEGVNPRETEGTVYKNLEDVPYKIDVIDLCIHPTKGIEVVRQAKDLNIQRILIQPGAESSEILDFCRDNGITAIEGCALVELSYYKRVK